MSEKTANAHKRSLSVAMIVRDEQDALPDSIAGVAEIADEIVVLDTGSGDGTPEAARRLGAKVHQRPWDDDFSAARNACAEQVSGDWVLWLNAGERLAPGSAGEIRRFIDDQGDPGKVCLMMVELPPGEPQASCEQMAQVRLIPRRSDLRFQGRVRESLTASIEAAGLSYDAAPGRIVTHPRQHDPQFKAERARRNLTLVAREGDGSGQPSLRCLLATGEACFDLGYKDRAAETFRRAIAVAPHGSTEMLEAYFGLLTCFDGEEAGRQLSVCLKALEVFPLDAHLLCAMGHYLQNQKRLDLAARSFETAARHGQVDPQTWHLAEIDAVAAVCCSLAHQALGRDEEARNILRETLAKRPASYRLRRHLIEVDIRLGRGDKAVEIVDGMPLDEEARSALRQAVTGACLAARSEWAPALAKLQSAYLAGCRDPICLRWLAIALLSAGQRAGVEPILRQWQQQQPGNREVQLYLDALETTPPTAAETPTAERPGRTTDRKYRVDAPSSPGGLAFPPSELPQSIIRATGDRDQHA